MQSSDPQATRRQCNAQRKSGRGPCHGPAVVGSTKCRMHGGKGSGAPLTTGRWPKGLGKFAADYLAAEADQELFDFRRVISALDMICVRLGARAAEYDTSDFRKRALQLFNIAADAEDPMGAMRNLGEFLENGVSEDRAFRELRESCTALAEKIRDAEGVRLAKEQSINVKDANAWLLQFFLSVREVAGAEIERKVREKVGQTVARARKN